jgi:DNA polymerase-3 subunit epsilon
MDFLALDLETANSNSDSVCELALVRFEGGVEVASWSQIIRPVRSWQLEPINFSKHGISQDEILAAPTLGDVWSELVSLLNGLPVVAHGATQDLNKLFASAKSTLGESWDFPKSEYFCSLVLSKRTSSLQLEHYTIRDLASEFQIPSPDIERSGILVHSAETDARACGLVSLALIERNEVKSLGEMAKKLGVKTGQIQNGGITQKSVSKTSNSFFGSSAPNGAEYALMREDLKSAGWGIEGHRLSNKSILLTLGLKSMTDAEFYLACALTGADLKSGVSAKLDYLVEGVDSAGKYERGQTGKSKKARELNQDAKNNISIIDETEFLALLGSEVVEAVKELSVKRQESKKASKLGISEEELEMKEKRYQQEQAKRELAESDLREFLKNPTWSTKKLMPGEKICFTQLDWELEHALSERCSDLGFVVTKSVTKDLGLLVIEDKFTRDSAKLREALRKGLEVTLLSIFLESNPDTQVSKKKSRGGFFGLFG